jgi:hypothetical protein
MCALLRPWRRLAVGALLCVCALLASRPWSDCSGAVVGRLGDSLPDTNAILPPSLGRPLAPAAACLSPSDSLRRGLFVRSCQSSVGWASPTTLPHILVGGAHPTLFDAAIFDTAVVETVIFDKATFTAATIPSRGILRG